MKLRSMPFIAAVAAFTAACGGPPAANNSAPSNTNSNANTNTVKTETSKPTTDLNALAAKVVNQSAGVKEGEIVLISGASRDAELLENLTIEVEKVGGHPLVLLDNENLGKRYYAEVPEKYDSAEQKVGLALAKMANVSISVDSSITENTLEGVPPARLAARAKAGSAVNKEFISHKVRSINIGNDLYPTEWRAKRFEMDLGAFSKLFWEGVNIDYTALQASGEKARTALTGKEVEITHPNGTNVKVTLDTRPAYISDGIVSADDVAKGNFNVYLPAGEAAVALTGGSGKFVIEKDFFRGKEMHNVVLNFENGKLTSMTGEGDGFAAMKADFDALGEGKDALSYLDIGINPNYALAPSSKLGNWVSAGMVSLGTGNNTWLGGTNESTGAVGGHLAGCTVKVDGKVIVENGTLKL